MVKLDIGIIAAAFFAYLPRTTFAVETPSIEVGGESLYVKSGTKSNSNKTATYSAATNTLKLKDFSTAGKISIKADKIR